MTSIQTKFFERLETLIAERNKKFELVTAFAWANTGQGYIQRKTSLVPEVEFKFDFQSSYASFIVNEKHLYAPFRKQLNTGDVSLEYAAQHIAGLTPLR